MVGNAQAAHETFTISYVAREMEPVASPPSEDASIRFLLRLGRAMHDYGYSAEQLERGLAAMAGRLGLEGQFFTTPTSILAAIGPIQSQRTFLIRTEPGTIDLGKLHELDELQTEVLDSKLTPSEGLRRVEALSARPGRYGAFARIAAAGAASVSASVFLGGSARDAAMSGIVGAIIGAASVRIEPRRASARLFESAMAVYAGPISQTNVALSGVVALLPGLQLTLAMSELATGRLASGNARLMAALTVFVSLGIGVALGARVSILIFGAAQNLPTHKLAEWAAFAVVPLAAIAFTIVFRARPREFVPIVIAGGLALGVLLVPGSIGFSSLSSLLDRQVVPGVESAFRTVMISVALTTGLLIADVLVPPRRGRGNVL